MQPLSTSSPRQRTPSLEWRIHRLIPPSTPDTDTDHDQPRQTTPLPRMAPPPPHPALHSAAGDIPRGRVHAAPEGDTRRVQGQDSGPRRRRTSTTAQKCPRRRRTPPSTANAPTAAVAPASTTHGGFQTHTHPQCSTSRQCVQSILFRCHTTTSRLTSWT